MKVFIDTIKIRTLLNGLRLDQTILAGKADLSKSGVSTALKTGRVDLKTAKKLAGALGVPLEEIEVVEPPNAVQPRNPRWPALTDPDHSRGDRKLADHLAAVRRILTGADESVKIALVSSIAACSLLMGATQQEAGIHGSRRAERKTSSN